MDVIGGNIGGGGTAAVGAAAAVPVITKNTHASIGDNAKVSAAGQAGVRVMTGGFSLIGQDTRFTPSATSIVGNTIDLGFDHGFTNGQEVVYDNGVANDDPNYASIPADTTGGGTTLQDGHAYHVIVIDAHHVQLAETYCDAVGHSGDPDRCSGSVHPITLHSLSSGVLYGESQRLVPTNAAGVRLDKSGRFDPNGNDVVGDEIFLPYDFSAIETGDKVVYASGGGTPIGGLVDGTTYYAIKTGPNSLKLAATFCDTGEAGPSNNPCPTPHTQNPITLSKLAGMERSHSLVKSGSQPAGDPREQGPRTIVALADSSRGVSVTATNSDDIAAIGVSAGFAGTAAVNLSGAVEVVNVDTTAHIGKSAEINCGASCASNVVGADPEQSVRVAAGNQYHELSIAATIAVAGTVGVGVGVGVHLVTLKTDAYVDDGAWINAAKDVSITATAKDSVIAVVAGAAGGEVGVAGTVGVTIMKTHTYACLGDWIDTSTQRGCFGPRTDGVTVVAGGNLLVSASDDTKVMLITASLAGGYVGVGVAVGVAIMDKDTRAFVGRNSSVDAKGETSDGLAGIYDGSSSGSGFGVSACPGTTCYHGVAVQATSKEDVFGLAAAAGGGFVGVAGGVGVTLLTVATMAFIAESVFVNQLGTTSNRQSVNVTAVDTFKSLTVAGGIGGGFVGVAGGVDIGIANTSVQAYIGNDSTVSAAANVDVNALSRKDVSTYAVSIGGGFVGVAGSVSVWTVGTQATTTYHDAPAGPDRGTWSNTTATSTDPDVYYHKGDVVQYGSPAKTYAAKKDQPLTVPTNTTDWEPETNALAPAPSSHDGRFKGTWTEGTSYALGDFVRHPSNGLHYKATAAGPSTTLQPHANLGQWVNAVWSSGFAYAEGDQVFDTDGNRYQRQHVEPPATFNASKHPKDNADQWHGFTKGGSGQGSADEAAPGNDENGAPGYKNILMGSAAPAPSAWVSGTAYLAGAKVTYSGGYYKADHDVPLARQAMNPHDNTADWSTDSDALMNSRVAAQKSSTDSSIASAAPSDPSSATNALARTPSTTVPPGTFAAINGTIVAGHSVRVRANDDLKVLSLAGAVAGGFVGVGAAVVVTNVQSATEAQIGPGSKVTAGSGGSDVVSVDATMHEDFTGIRFAGSGGFVAIGAEVAVLNDTGTQRAHIDDLAEIGRAGGGIDVTSTADRTINTFGIGVQTGAFTTGAAIAVTNVDGDNTASIGNVTLGGVGTVGHINVTATDDIEAPTLAISIAAAGGVGIGGAVSFVSLDGTTSASSGAHGPLGSGGMSVTAGGLHSASAKTLNIATGAVAAGLTISRVNNGRSTEAIVTSTANITTSGAVLVKSDVSNIATAFTPGGTAGGATLAILVPFGFVTGDTRARGEGTVAGSASTAVPAN